MTSSPSLISPPLKPACARPTGPLRPPVSKLSPPTQPAIRRFALTGRLQAPTGQIIIKDQAAYRAPKTLAAGGNYVNIISGGQAADLRAWQAVPADQRAGVYRRYVQWVKADRRHRQYAGFAAFCGDTKNAPTPTSGIDAF